MKSVRLIAATVGAALAVFTSGSVLAATYNQKTNGLVPYTSSSLRTLNNANVTKVNAGSYRFAPNPFGANTISTTGGNQSWTLKTKYLLPRTHSAKGNAKYDMTNPQSAAYAGGYLYVVYQPHKYHNKGFIARYKLSAFGKLSYAKAQAAMSGKAGNSAVKLGRFFTTGHGQSLAYDAHSKSLWMWRDTVMGTSKRSTLQRISASSLTPNKAITFSMNSHGANISGGHNLAFDTAGNAYFWTIDSKTKGVKVYKGKIGTKSVKFRLTRQLFKVQPGNHQQAMGYNPKNGRLYLVADDSIASFPAKKLNGKGSLTNADFKYSRFNSGREFESLIFDAAGHGTLLTNRNPELLASTSVY